MDSHSKWLFDPGPNIIFEKVKKLQNSSMILRESASDLLSRGHIRPPPPGLGLMIFKGEAPKGRVASDNQKTIRTDFL